MKTAPLHLQSKLVKKRCDYLRKFFNLISTHHSSFILFAPYSRESTPHLHFSLHTRANPLLHHIFRSIITQIHSSNTFSAPYSREFTPQTHFPLHNHANPLLKHIFRSILTRIHSTNTFSTSFNALAPPPPPKNLLHLKFSLSSPYQIPNFREQFYNFTH